METESRVARKRAGQPFEPAIHEEAPTPMAASAAELEPPGHEQPVAPDAPASVTDPRSPGVVPDAAITHDRDAELEWLLKNPVHLGIDPALKALQDFAAASAAGPAHRTRRHYLVALGAVAVAIGLVVGAVAFVKSHHTSHDRAITARPTSAQVAAASRWAARELAHRAPILADSKARAVLAAKGFANVVGSATAGGTKGGGATLSFDYVLATPALRTAARSDRAVARALNSSVPIAVFGGGKQQVVVRQVRSGSIHRAQSSRASAAIRRSAGRQLLANPALHAVGAARTVLRSGDLDFRAATVLALMAGSAHVSILSIDVSLPEHAAGLPARSMDVRTDAEAAVEAILAGLPPSYAPSADIRRPNGADHLVWPIDLDLPTILK